MRHPHDCSRRWLARRRRRSSASAGDRRRARRARARARRPRSTTSRGVHPRSSRRAATIDDCQEAPNPMLPETNEIIWGGFGFCGLRSSLWKFGLPAIKQAMDDRTEKIRGDLRAPRPARPRPTAVLDDYRAQLADAKTEAGRIIEEARQPADQIKPRPGGPPPVRAGRAAHPGGHRHRGRQGPGHRRPAW